MMGHDGSTTAIVIMDRACHGAFPTSTVLFPDLCTKEMGVHQVLGCIWAPTRSKSARQEGMERVFAEDQELATVTIVH